MNTQIEATISMIAAMLVLFSALLDPVVSVGLAVSLLLAFSVYKFVYARREQ